MRAAITDVRQIEAGSLYTVGDVASLFRVNASTPYGWLKAGLLAPVPRPGNRGPYRFLGSTILALFGERLASVPEPSETRAQREARAAADARAIEAVLRAK